MTIGIKRGNVSWPKVKKLFSCSIELSMNFQLQIKLRMLEVYILGK